MSGFPMKGAGKPDKKSERVAERKEGEVLTPPGLNFGGNIGSLGATVPSLSGSTGIMKDKESSPAIDTIGDDKEGE